MMEFSLRTHQGGIPDAGARLRSRRRSIWPPRRFASKSAASTAVSNTASSASSGAATTPVDRLAIRFNAGETPVAVHALPSPHDDARTWSLWEYRWRPASPGVYNIALRAADTAIRTRRLDVSFYVRRVVIDEV